MKVDGGVGVDSSLEGIVVGFARNPMSLAYSANDIQLLSKGRFILGLGSQIKPHITRRFSMEWSKPAARMREMVLATKAIWNSWNTGEKLDFRGDFYQHTLMNPMFHPGENPHGAPRVAIAGVGELMPRWPVRSPSPPWAGAPTERGVPSTTSPSPAPRSS